MKKVLIIMYGELSTKKDNINYFLKILKNNINSKLKKYDYEIIYDFGRMYIYSDNLEEITNELKFIFGIQSYAIGYEQEEKDIEVINKNILSLLRDKNFKTFKVVTKRSDKSYHLTSMEVSRIVGAFLLKNIKDVAVDVINPDAIINIEVRREKVLFFFDKESSLGGYPVGSQKGALLMLSGGIDSPVAGYMALKRGVALEVIYFDTPPHTSELALNKVKKLAKALKKYDSGIKLYIVNFTEIQESIYKGVINEYVITLIRKFMYKISESIAIKNNLLAIINGESIGQVASQTLTSMAVTSSEITLPIIRPLSCFDKLEIIDIAKKIDTYNTSIEPFDDCCTLFVPKHPVINPDKRKVETLFESLDSAGLIERALENTKIDYLQDEVKYDGLL